MVAGGLKCPVEPDLRHDIWVKLMGNVAFNPISALTRASMIGICQNMNTRELVIEIMRETLAVAASLGVHPDISIERRLAGAERAGDHKTSTLQDLEKGKPLELDAILGAVVELADLTGTEIPALRVVHALADLAISIALVPERSTLTRPLRADLGLAARDFGARHFYTAPSAPFDEYERTRTATASLGWRSPDGAGWTLEPRLSARRHATGRRRATGSAPRPPYRLGPRPGIREGSRSE
jgi:hypothetical protein